MLTESSLRGQDRMRPASCCQISYLSGGLESAHIRKTVCDILEGDARAFQERAPR
jgi:hypothetical protein